MNSIHLDGERCYDGTQLCSHWIYRQTALLGDAIASFSGPADVPLAHMVDLVDVAEEAPIFSRSMLHFLVEHFEGGLPLAIARQRLIAAIAAEELRARGAAVERRGDDLYEGDRKISVSIATASPVSTLIHFAMNVASEGTPVPTKGLADYGLDPRELADAIRTRYCDEIRTMGEARCKVRAVK